MKTSMEKRRQQFFILIAFFAIALMLSLLWYYFRRDYEAILAALFSTVVIIETITIRQKKWIPSAVVLFIAILLSGAVVLFNNYQNGGNSTEATTITVRVTDETGEAISRAKVLLFYGGPPISQFTDSNGIAHFEDDSNRKEAQIVIEQNDYQIHEQTISLSKNQDITIQLERKDKDNHRVIVRVMDDTNNLPIEGANVILIVSSNVHDDTTDSNGLSRFDIEFPQQTVDAELQVNTDEHEINNKSITLQPDRVQDIRLDPITQEVSITNTQTDERSDIPAPQPSDNNNDSDANVTISTVTISPVPEVEPNNLSEEAQHLKQIGMSVPVTSIITAATEDGQEGDQDWYRFTATAGETYNIELFDVANTLALVPRRYNCGEGTKSHSGLRLIVNDPSQNEVSRQCTPTGAGNVHSVLQFTAGVNGDYYLQIASHAPNVEGNYSLRILPKYNQTNANWDTISFEPNNRIDNAYQIATGWENALQSTIEPRNEMYSTNRADRDSYRFEAVAGQTYVVELFNVSNTLSLKSNRYNCGEGTKNHAGMWLGIFDPFGNEVVRQCTPTGAANVHNSVQFTAGNAGIFHIVVYPHENSVAGSYSIRVLPKHDEPNAGWDSTIFEPNNRAPNAYQLELGTLNTLQGFIEAREQGYSTNQADRDWYFISGEAGKTYRVEILDIDNRLELEAARYNCGEGTRNYTGLWLGVFDPSVNEISRQCTPNGAENIHTFVEFTASRDGMYYFLIYPHESTLSGDYKIRIVEK